MYSLRMLAPLVLMVAIAGRCLAAPPASEERVNITVAVILANGDGKVDEKLTCVAKEVRKTHPKLTGFHLGTMTTLPVTLGTAEKFKLEDGQEATISVKHCTACPGRFCLEVKSKALVGEMTYSSVCGKYFPLVTGYQTKDHGDQLIIVFKVESCAAKEKK